MGPGNLHEQVPRSREASPTREEHEDDFTDFTAGICIMDDV